MSSIRMGPASIAVLALVVVAAALPAVAADTAATAKPLDAFKEQVAADLLALEQRIHSKHSERVEAAESKFVRELGNLKTSLESLSKSSGDNEKLQNQIKRIQTELSSTHERLDKTSEKIRLLQAENIALKQKIETIQSSSFSSSMKAWSDYITEKWHSTVANSGIYTDVIKTNAVKFADFAQSKSVWLIEISKDLYAKYFQHVHPFVLSTSEKVIVWAQQTHQKWRPFMDQQIFKIHGFVQQHPKLSEYQLEKYITVESLAAIAIVLATVVLRLGLYRCCRRSSSAAKSPTSSKQ